MALKQIIVMRTDLNMRKGKMIAQGAHASVAAVLHNLEHPLVKEWLDNSFTKICVGSPSEDELMVIYANAKGNGLIAELITDNGATEFHGNKTITCCAIGPAQDVDLQSVTGHLKLL